MVKDIKIFLGYEVECHGEKYFVETVSKKKAKLFVMRVVLRQIIPEDKLWVTSEQRAMFDNMSATKKMVTIYQVD